MNREEQNRFVQYLYDLGQMDSCIDSHLDNLEYFEDWCNSKCIKDKEHLSRNGILEYVQFMQNIPVKVGTQNIRLNSLNKYYESLKLEGLILKNPVRGLKVRGQKKKVVRNPLNNDDLLELFNGYSTYLDSLPQFDHLPHRDEVTLRNKTIASLVIFQGCHTGELKKLTVQDVNLTKSTIYIPSTGGSNSREVELHITQILAMYKYLNSIPSEQEQLFDYDVQKGFYSILQELRGINPIVTNLRHIRASRILTWIQIHGKRKAQYMIGHKFVSTTESYEIQDTSELSNLLQSTHLFG